MALQNKAKIKLVGPARGMAYVDAGQGDAVVFVHGSLCDYRYWEPQLVGLSKEFWVIAPSLSHFWPRLPSSVGMPFSWSLHVYQLAEFIAKLQRPGGVHLVGHSRGASIAYQLALKHPKLLSSLTLVDPGGPTPDDASDGSLPPAVAALRLEAAALIEQGYVDEGLKMFVDSVSRPGFWDRSYPFFQNMARDNAHTLAPQVADGLPPYLEREAATIPCPTLLVSGERSPDTYRHNAEKLAGWIPNTTPLTIAGASHGMTVTHAQRFNRELLGFLRKLASAPS